MRLSCRSYVYALLFGLAATTVLQESAYATRIAESYPAYLALPIREGETVSDLCRAVPRQERGMSITECADRALRLNRIEDPECIQPGTVIVLPVAASAASSLPSSYFNRMGGPPSGDRYGWALVLGLLLVGIGLAGAIAVTIMERRATDTEIVMNTTSDRPDKGPGPIVRPVQDSPPSGSRFGGFGGARSRESDQPPQGDRSQVAGKERKESVRQTIDDDGMSFQDACTLMDKALEGLAKAGDDIRVASAHMKREVADLRAEETRVQARINAAVAEGNARTERAERERTAAEDLSIASRKVIASRQRAHEKWKAPFKKAFALRKSL
jgi:hypothetical protein